MPIEFYNVASLNLSATATRLGALLPSTHLITKETRQVNAPTQPSDSLAAPLNDPQPASSVGADDVKIELRDAPPATATGPPWPNPLAPEAFHGLAGDVVRTLDPHTEADPAAVLIQFLTATGNFGRRIPHFVVESTRHYTNLFAVLVGETAKARKGTSWGQIRSLFGLADEVWVEDRVATGLSSGEGFIHQVRDPVTKTKPNGEEKVIDPGVADKRLLVIEEEFASTLRVLERQGNTLSPNLRNAWDDKKLQSLVRNSPLKATEALVSIIAHITRTELQRYLTCTEAGNGFANRFLWLCVRRSKRLPDGGRLTDRERARLVERLKAVQQFATDLNAVGGMTPGQNGTQIAAQTQAAATVSGNAPLEFDVTATAIWHAVYGPLSDGKPGLFGAVIGRAEAQVKRLALIYAVLDCSKVISRKHLLAALAVWDYCEASARHIFGDALGDPVADELLKALRAAGSSGLTRTEIRDLFGRNRNEGEIGRALGVLLTAKLAYPRSEATGGRPAERWLATGLSSSSSFMSYLDIAKRA